MGRPGNKRLQRAMYGASPSSTGGMTTEGEGRYEITRVTGSVINNGGNMRSGGYPRIGMGLEFLRKTRCNPLCDSFVGSDEDLKTQLALATAFVAARLAADTVLTNATTALRLAATATGLATIAATASNSAVDVATEAVAIKTEATALADYNAADTALSALTSSKNVAALGYIAAATPITGATASALTIYVGSAANAAVAVGTSAATSTASIAANDLAAYNTAVTDEATKLAAWIAAM